MNDKPKRRASKKARPLLLAAAGAVVLIMDGCDKMTSGNLPVFRDDMATGQDQAPPADLARPTDGGTGG